MKPGADRTDACPIVALLAGALLLAVNRLGASVSPDRLLGAAASVAPSLAPLALGALAIASALAPQRLFTTHRTLRARRAVALMPADEFDPTPAQGRRKAVPSRSIREKKECGRATRQRPRPGTGGCSSHADSKYLADDGLDGFVRWFADWWLRRGRRLTDHDRDGG